MNLDKAKIDPASVYKSPKDVLLDKHLSRDEKIDILRRWAYDERERMVAEEENMLAPESEQQSYLADILKSLLELGVGSDQDDPPPTKQG